jgi:hypothetical protein
MRRRGRKPGRCRQRPTTIALIRTAPGLGTANPLASQQYVNATVSGRALDTTVVHLTGGETITGAKQFAAPPAVPTPVAGTDAVNKAYVDAALANVGSGSFVSKNGDTMSGPLTLASEPGRMKLAEDRIAALEKNDIRRSVYDRLVNATIAMAISAAIAMHDHWVR